MLVILQERIKKLGDIGDLVEVASGFARNFLFRKGKALRATKENVAEVEARRAELVKIDQAKRAEAEKRAKKLESMGDLEVMVLCNTEGKLFGAVQTSDLMAMIESKGHKVDKAELTVTGAPIRHLGVYDLVVECHADVNAVIKLNVVSSEPLPESTADTSDETETESESATSDDEGESSEEA